MEFPQPPTDPERKILIEKLAVFVARNGHDFEKLTRNKQRHNPKFSFLFGGNHSDYYRYRVAAEKTGFQQLDNGNQMPNNSGLPQQQGYSSMPQQQGYSSMPQQQQQGYVPPSQQQGYLAASQQRQQQDQGCLPTAAQQGYVQLQRPPPPTPQLQGYSQPAEQQLGYLQQPAGFPVPPPTQQQQQQVYPAGYLQQQPPGQPHQSVAVAGEQQQVPTITQNLAPSGSAPADPELAELARQTGVPAEKLTRVLEELLPSSATAAAAATPEKLLAAFVMKRLQAVAATPAVTAASAVPAPVPVARAPLASTPAAPASAARDMAAAAAPAPATTIPAATPAPATAHAAAPETSAPAQDAAVIATATSVSAAAAAAPAQAQDDAALAQSTATPTQQSDMEAELSLQASAPAATPAAISVVLPAATEANGSTQEGVLDGEPDAKRPRVNGPGDDVPASANHAGPDTVAVATASATAAQTATVTATSAAAAPAAAVSPGAPGSVTKPLNGTDEIAALKKTVRDPDALFALSVAEALKRLPMEGKATLKIAIMEVVAEIRTSQEPPPAEATASPAGPAAPAAGQQAEKPAVPVEEADLSRPPPVLANEAGEDEFSEAFFIGEDAAEAARANEAEQPELPLAPPIKKQCVPKSAPFADQLADAKARAAAMAREAAEQSRATRELQRQGPPLPAGAAGPGYPEYGPPPPAGYPGYGPPPGPAESTPQGHWPGQAPYQPGQPTQPPPARNGHPPAGQQRAGGQYRRPAAAGGQYGQRTAAPPPPLAGPPTIQPIRPLMAGSPSLGDLLQQHLSPEQIQQQIQLLQQLSSLQQQQQQAPADQIALQLQAAAVMGVEPKKQNWDQPPQQPSQQADAQLANRQQQQQQGSWGRPLPAPSAAMPRDPLQRGGLDRRYRSPPRRYRH